MPLHLEVHLGYMCTIQLWIWTTSVRCAMIDDLMTFVLRTCRAPDAHIGAYFLFRMRFTDLHGGYMCDDRWFHDICSSDLSCIRCHTGAYFPFQMRSMDLHLCCMIDDRWFHVAQFLTCHTFDAHTGAISPHHSLFNSVFRASVSSLLRRSESSFSAWRSWLFSLVWRSKLYF